MTGLTIKYARRKLESRNKETRQMARQSMRDAINVQGTEAIKETIKEVSRETKIPAKVVRNRLDQNGKIKAKRVTRNKATVGNLNSTISVYLRGVPMFQIAGKQTKNGIRARGRVYKSSTGPFWAAGKVWYRKPGKKQGLLLPKFGLRKQLIERYNKKLISREAQRAIRQRYDANMTRKLRALKP